MLLPRRGQSPARGLARNGNELMGEWNEPSGTNRSDGERTDVQRPRREAWDRRTGREAGPPAVKLDHYSPEPEADEQPPRNGKISRDAGALQAPRVAGSRRSRNNDVAPVARGMDHYSPPPEDDEAPPKPGLRMCFA
jgi:hypothetical protein